MAQKCYLCGEDDPMNFEHCEHCGKCCCDDCIEWCSDEDDDFSEAALCFNCRDEKEMQRITDEIAKKRDALLAFLRKNKHLRE